MGTKNARFLKSKKNKSRTFNEHLQLEGGLIAGTLKRKKKHCDSMKREIDDINKGGELLAREIVKTPATTEEANKCHKVARKKRKKSLTPYETKFKNVNKGGKLSSMEGEVKTQEATSTKTSAVSEAQKVSKKKKKFLAVKTKSKTDKSVGEKSTNKSMEDGHSKGEQSMKLHSRVEETSKETNTDLVDEICDVDTDCSKGMKKWLNQYWSRRPGLKILQDNIDQFLMAHEAAEEKARKERENLAVEGGWTVVVHHKGRKKTTDAETGVTVGSFSQAAVIENLAKKKEKEIPFDFYRFQKHEARRNEVMQLQNKFEQEKKRIQQLRAGRKFRPY